MRRGKAHFQDASGKENKTELKNGVEQTVDGTRCYCWQSSGSGPTFWVTETPKEAKSLTEADDEHGAADYGYCLGRI